MLSRTWRETEYRLDVCSATSGAHIVIYWAHKELYEVKYLKMSIPPMHFMVEELCFILLSFKAWRYVSRPYKAM
jgi:hypothetical protein